MKVYIEKPRAPRPEGDDTAQMSREEIYAWMLGFVMGGVSIGAVLLMIFAKSIGLF